MELSLSHTLCLFNIFCEFDGKENCAQVLDEECIKMLDTKKRVLITHKCRGSIVVLSISKSVEPNKEQKEMISCFQ